MELYVNIAYLISSVCFIYGLKMLSHPKTARNGNMIASLGMLLAILATTVPDALSGNSLLNFRMILIAMILGSILGGFFAFKVEMTQMPQLVAIFNGFGGGASAFVAAEAFGVLDSTFFVVSVVLSLVVGTLTLTGSFIAFGKLQGIVTTKPVTFPGQQIINGILAITVLFSAYMIPNYGINSFYIIVVISALLGILLVIPIGGADMQ